MPENHSSMPAYC